MKKSGLLTVSILLLAISSLIGCKSSEIVKEYPPAAPIELGQLPDKVFSPSEVDQPARPSKEYSSFRPKIDVPDEVKRNRLSGKPVIRLTISDQGEVLKAEVEESAHPLLDEMALQISIQAGYQPAILNGKPVVSYFLMPISLGSKR